MLLLFIYLHYNLLNLLLVLCSILNPAFVCDRNLRAKDITVNLWVVNERWLFSLLWCAGASSVTTNSCDLLKDMDEPDWLIVSNSYSCMYNSLCFTFSLFHYAALKTISWSICLGADKFVQVFSKVWDTPWPFKHVCVFQGLERYRTIWIIVDVASVLIMTGLYVFQW